MAERVDFWFDPICPFAYATSRWILEVEKVRDIEVKWNVMSLGVLNEDKNPAPTEDDDILARWIPARTSTAVAQTAPEKVGDFYSAIGYDIHVNGHRDFEAASRRALAEIGLDGSLVDEAKTNTYDDAMRTSHESGISQVGQDVGTPIVAFAGTAFFGPVITRVPTGEDAGKIFDGAVAMAEYPYFFELKRSRTESPQLR
ncbi:mycothiol-dependent nitroreductase Rv2466c family protein [Nesterenkonia natronophila]|uniref:Disulfide bond formation protein DsbA n=1 Tax=Nesterenkonia natronophila TaxID=2174932 RepID=A0A3A4FYB9_9MICC|nr:disulfide bond formation protein DsbA [Nesterenkonia natronophila]RJN31049.1 disulfide bond formation protein DsbA [Nesterenkonia natronophila]